MVEQKFVSPLFGAVVGSEIRDEQKPGSGSFECRVLDPAPNLARKLGPVKFIY